MSSHALLSSLINKTEAPARLEIATLLPAVGHSVLLGIMLVGISFVAGQVFDSKRQPKPGAQPEDPINAILGSANLLFLCVGLTGIMLLINNSLVRAFGIVAVISIVRFRVKVSRKEASASYLFSILAGIACGLSEIAMAWVVVGVYASLQILLLGAVSLTYRQRPAAAAVDSAQTASSVPQEIPVEQR